MIAPIERACKRLGRAGDAKTDMGISTPRCQGHYVADLEPGRIVTRLAGVASTREELQDCMVLCFLTGHWDLGLGDSLLGLPELTGSRLSLSYRVARGVICLPPYNEAENIRKLAPKLREGLVDKFVAVNDGSTDEGPDILRQRGIEVLEVVPNRSPTELDESRPLAGETPFFQRRRS